MANSEGSEAMLNRVMTKDNIGVATLLEVRKEMMEASCESTLCSDLGDFLFGQIRLARPVQSDLAFV